MSGKFRFNLIPLVFRIFQCIAFVSVLSLTAQGVWAQETPKNNEPEKIKIGDGYYTRGQIIADFLDVAFTEKVWNEDAEKIEPGGFAKTLEYRAHMLSDGGVFYQKLESTAPWFIKYILRAGHIPVHGVVSKWDGKITVSMGWPDYYPSRPAIPPEKQGTAVLTSRYNHPGSEKFYPLIEEQFNNIAPTLRKLTNLPIEMIHPNDLRDRTENYARIRIIPMKSWLRRGWSHVFQEFWTPYSSENIITGGVLFESSEFMTMDAYLLPESDNTPGLVICKINMQLEENMFRSLVNECLVRALGLPGLSKKQDALLGDWRIKEKLPMGITEHDRQMIQLLYHSSIKTGMDKNRVIQELSDSK